jgi:hypothetical protein
MARPRAVLLNDTSARFHHGCSRVMRLLVRGLEDVGIEIAARSPARADWAKDEAFLAAIRSAQVVVINGEGTLHDGAPLGARLLSVLDHPDARGKPVALVNALWERNPPEWDRWLRELALASARDSGSAEAMAGVRGGSRWVPDLSLSAVGEIVSVARHGIVVGDSVRFETRQRLARSAQRLGATYVPTKTLRHPAWEWPTARRLLWRAYNGVWTGRVPRFGMPDDEMAYLTRLGRAEAHVTGRFHAVCLSFLTGTPVLAVASRTSKIERLLRDAGLGDGRLLSPEALESLTLIEARRPWEPEEREAIAEFLLRAREGAQALFAEIRALCG